MTSSRLGFLIGGPFDEGSGGPGGWWILDEPELHFGEQVVVGGPAGSAVSKVRSVALTCADAALVAGLPP